MAYAFDGTTKRITLIGVTVLSLPDLYSRYKDWLLAGHAGFLPAFEAVGGDIPAIPLYLFLLNGWRIVPMSSDHTLTVVQGVLEVKGGGDAFVDPVGAYKIRVYREAPGIAIGYLSGGVSGPSADQIAAAVRTALDVELAKIHTAAESASATVSRLSTLPTPIPVNVARMNGARVVGSGTQDNKWRGEGV